MITVNKHIYTDIQILFGDPSLDPIFNRLLLTTRRAILKNKSS